MNIISHLLYALENNTIYVYSGLFFSFLLFTFFHKNKFSRTCELEEKGGKNSGSSGGPDKPNQKYDYIKLKVNDVSEEESNILSEFCRKYCYNILRKWERSCKKPEVFTNIYEKWLDTDINWPDGLKKYCVSRPHEASTAVLAEIVLPSPSTSTVGTSIGHSGERKEASEARNKDFRRYRHDLSRKLSRKATNEDVLNNLLLSSDLYLSSFRPKLERKHKLLTADAKQLLLADHFNKDNIEFVDIVRKFPDEHDDDDEEQLVPAIPEDTPHIPYEPLQRPDEEILERSREFYELMDKRRTVRSFSPEPIPQQVIDNIVKTAGTSPSGAHTEPWTFVVVQDPETKAAIREIVEDEEDLNYNKRMSRQWVTDLKPFKTKPQKPYLTEAPVLLLVFRQTHSFREDGKKRMHYYSEISVAIAAGFILAAVQYCGLVALTSTPLNCSPRLRTLLSRPSNERLELLLPIGKPQPNTTVPDLQRKSINETMIKC